MKKDIVSKKKLMLSIAVCALLVTVAFSSVMAAPPPGKIPNDDDWNTWDNEGNMFAIPEGNVGIGTTDPSGKLEVAGTIHSTSGGFKFPDGTVQTTAADTAGLLTMIADLEARVEALETILSMFLDNDGDGYTENEGDCDDSNPDIYPGATEICDGMDNDCDGIVDEGCAPVCGNGICEAGEDCANCPADCGECPDNDGDGYTEAEGDCDDSNPDIHPGATEVCNGIDDDCDGLVDEDVVCDDGIDCTLDNCVSGSCTHTPDNSVCDDGNYCTDDSCDPATGCVNTCNNNPCDDGDACTQDDTCIGCECVGGTPVNCDDGDPCTNDYCDPAIGCVNDPIPGC